MKITEMLVKHLVTLGLDAKHLDPATRVEAEVKAFASEQIVDEKLTPAKVRELTADAILGEAHKSLEAIVSSKVSALGDELRGSVKSLADTLTAMFAKQAESRPADAAKALDVAALTGASGGDGVSADAAAAKARVKSVAEQYATTKSVVTYGKSANEGNRRRFGADTPVRSFDGSLMEESSQLDRAIAGAWLKHMVRRAGVKVKMTEHDRALIEYAVHNCRFTGEVGTGSDGNGVTGVIADLSGQKATSDLVIKALLDDSTSGGLEAVPIEFDANVIMTAVLNGEVAPLVNWQDTSRRRIEGWQLGEVTMQTGPNEGTAITPLNTTSLVSAFDTSIYTTTGAMDIGLDFMDDAPNNIGAFIAERYGDAFQKELDRLVTAGAGSTEMLGVFNTVGITTFGSSAGSLPYATTDQEGLLFGVEKQYREESGQGAASKAVFIANDVVYKRFRQIPWDSTGNQRVNGLDLENYMLAGHPFKVVSSSVVASTTAGFFCMNRFRGYRRRGYTVVQERAGRSNRLSNVETIVVRARYGGQLTIPAAGCVTTDLPTS